ncbi:MAG: hypothetical protein A3F09_03895 [Chlamydiae bacterium RIFCSPHIGHO2_12_FULL_49_11]|nr:MAG: hypothetical protein A3F09_03895 [Chlamydiae bacterium RIFCSPHIGHO2_12_FULL_49_11]
MQIVKLRHVSEQPGVFYEAHFDVERGLNLISLKKGEVDLIEQSTRPIFEERMGGLGPLIGPHFYERREQDIPFTPDASMFPHVRAMQREGKKDMFSHGIARYVQWNEDSTDTTLTAHLSGMDTHHGMTLAALEGFNFRMDFKAHLSSSGLNIDFKCESEGHPCILGLHYYFSVHQPAAFIRLRSEEKYNDKQDWKPLRPEWKREGGRIELPMTDEYDFVFVPKLENGVAHAELIDKSQVLSVSYTPVHSEHSFQIYHPKEAPFVCIEPVSATNARRVTATKNHLKIRISSTNNS